MTYFNIILSITQFLYRSWVVVNVAYSVNDHDFQRLFVKKTDVVIDVDDDDDDDDDAGVVCVLDGCDRTRSWDRRDA